MTTYMTVTPESADEVRATCIGGRSIVITASGDGRDFSINIGAEFIDDFMTSLFSALKAMSLLDTEGGAK